MYMSYFNMLKQGCKRKIFFLVQQLFRHQVHIRFCEKNNCVISFRTLIKDVQVAGY